MVIKIPGLPSPNLPLVDNMGKINPVWFQFFNSLTQLVGTEGTSGKLSVSSLVSTGPISGTDGTFTGTMEFGAYAAGTFNQTGYIQINDAKTGTVRRLMVG